MGAKRVVIAAGLGSILLALMGGASGQEVTYERLLNADNEPHNWLTYYGNYRGWRYSALSQINRTNVKRLVVKWAFQTGPDENLEVTPLVVDGVMYITNENDNIFGLDAATGRMLWRHNYKLPDAGKMPNRIWGAGRHRGVSLARGKVLIGTEDAHVLALDARTGKLLWKVQVGDFEAGHTVSSPPLIAKDKAIVGLVTDEFPSRGFIDAYDIETGKQTWRSYTIPGPGEPGNETWGAGEAWKHGCAGAWLPGTYDPELNLVYVGTDGPCPQFDGEVRPGDNLYSNSMLALDAETGKLKWYFQTSPHSVWGFDTTNELVLVDTELHGRPVKALVQANKNGYFYVLDRTDGRFLSATPFVPRITWTKGLDATGRPTVGNVPTATGGLYCPSGWGGKSWNHVAYSPQTGHVYVPAMDLCSQVKVVRQEPRRGGLYMGGEGTLPREGAYGVLEALDVKTGEIRWQHRSKYPMLASVLATGGGLVFTGDLQGNALALDASSGELLWTFNTGSGHRGSPMTYAVDGRQYVAIPSGWGGATARFFPLTFPELADATLASTLFVFGLFEE